MPNHSSVTKTDILNVVCLVAIDEKKHLLATQRAADKPLGLLWEFPGGKVDKGESPEIALRREIQEELSIELDELTEHPAVTHTYEFGTIRLIPFITHVEKRLEISKLNAHEAAQWIPLKHWNKLQWAPADVPIIEQLLQTEVNR